MSNEGEDKLPDPDELRKSPGSHSPDKLPDPPDPNVLYEDVDLREHDDA